QVALRRGRGRLRARTPRRPPARDLGSDLRPRLGAAAGRPDPRRRLRRDFDPGVEDPDPSSLSGPLPRLLRRSKAVGAGIPGCAIPRGSLSHKFLRARSWALPRFSRSCLDSPRPTCRMPPMPIRPRALLPALLGLLLAAPAAAQD